jgi:GDP-mannose 4,6-dehydratase
MKIFITGITGFVGSHLIEYLQKLDNSIEISGLCRWRSNRENFKNIDPSFTLLEGDLLDIGSLIRILDQVKPDIIFHLGAQSYVLSSFKNPVQTILNNTVGTLNLLEAIRILKQDPVVHICSTSEVYGTVDQKYIPIREDCPLNPSSPYAVGKVGADMAALQYYHSYGIKTIRTRAFSHTGPRRGDVFAASAFSKQLAAIKLGLQANEIFVGNLDSVRTFFDVRDTVKCYWLAATMCEPGQVYNIGGNEPILIRDLLYKLFDVSGLKPEIKIIEELIRPSDVTLQIPCIDKFVAKTGWKKEISLEKTLTDLYTYWLEELKFNPWKYKNLKTIV